MFPACSAVPKRSSMLPSQKPVPLLECCTEGSKRMPLRQKKSRCELSRICF